MPIMGDGFGGLNPVDMPKGGFGGPRFGKPPMAGGGAPFTGSGSSGPVSAPQTPAAPSSMPYGQRTDPGAYGAPGAPGSSPLGIWQNWLNTMGPYLAQQPASEPMAESGGLSSLAPSSASPGSLKGYWGGDAPWQGNRGFRMLQ